MYYTMKQAAEKLKMTEHTIRYYTDMELFPCKRDKGNRRVFDEDAMNWLTGIKNLRACGMSIKSIKEYCDLCLQGDLSLQRRFEIIQEQKELAKTRLEDAQLVHDFMSRKAAHYQDIIRKHIPDDTNPSTWKM